MNNAAGVIVRRGRLLGFGKEFNALESIAALAARGNS
jgi:hypothetical protein